ncbi:malonyl-[acyl-carrier protein] O-methyltransferase BioC [Brenneria roseae subsp. americana]|uniref:Malonyl-[acyl-carrier protein] O-methyltransferase n=1 Tax=Brenneria roseae subsp. americana TaxID=1508507 RepID=A0A2U1TMJ2_9GAMM|nr:malonyl-ACP O-methyltransferase BioC [Brenneria roseae]PWC10618.1 malonyl-[acyl-carrier protein] O-methyltransferase BioC [Brenneria roseae subsp. americana]
MFADTCHKQAIAQAFGRAAASYDRFAELQRTSGERLLDLIPPHGGTRVLDAGCGTGYFSRYWQQQGKRVTALDLSPAMLSHASRHQAAERYVQGDIEHLPLEDGCVDISYSNLAVQWCDDLPRALAELYRVTRSEGIIAFSTLAEGSLSELSHAWTQLDGTRRVNHFLSAGAIEAACQPYRYQLRQERITCYFPDVLTLMKSLKGIGATWLHQGRAPGLLSRSRLNGLSSVYPRCSEGYPLSYQLIYGVIYRD